MLTEEEYIQEWVREASQFEMIGEGDEVADDDADDRADDIADVRADDRVDAALNCSDRDSELFSCPLASEQNHSDILSLR